jgi:hypothetical protein
MPRRCAVVDSYTPVGSNPRQTVRRMWTTPPLFLGPGMGRKLPNNNFDAHLSVVNPTWLQPHVLVHYCVLKIYV